MIYVYGAMLLHKAGKEVNESNLKNVLDAAGIPVDDGKVRSLVAALEGVNIEEAVKEATVPLVTSTTAQDTTVAKEQKKEEKKDEKKEEEAAAGLGALFG